MKIIVWSVILLSLFFLAACTCFQQQDVRATGPEQGRYRIGEQWVQLSGGRAEQEIVAGAASRAITMQVDEPVYGDLDGDGEDDAAVLLVQQLGGSGSFYYLAAALAANGGFLGTNAVFLGDRIDRMQIRIRNAQIVVLYRDRRADEPMTAEPTLIKARYLHLVGGLLQDVPAAGIELSAVQGWAIIGHEVRSFVPCTDPQPHWLRGESAALPDIKTAYTALMPEGIPYRPLFMALRGTATPRSDTGFGADYPVSFLGAQLLEADPSGGCRNELITVESPQPGATVSREIKVTGQARGNWYFEGDFPLLLLNGQGEVVARGFAVAQGPWMTEDRVPFSGTLGLQDVEGSGLFWLVLKKDNPSDRRELDDALVIPVYLE